MVDEFLSEEERAEAVKGWFRENWSWLALGVVVGLGGLVGWQYYERQQVAQAESAALLLQEMAKALPEGAGKADPQFKQLIADYGKTAYADQARLVMAQAAITNSKLDEAVTQLREVMDHTKDEELALVARLRLARVLIEQGKHDEALGLLDVNKAGAFVAQMHEIRGDALFAKGDASGAREAYQAALDANGQAGSGDTSLLQLKLQDVGGEARTAAAVENNAGAKE